MLELEPRHLDGPGAGGDDGVFELDGLRALPLAAVGDARGGVVGERRLALHQVDAVGLAELLDAARELVDDALLPGLHPCDVDGRVGVDTHLLGVTRVVGHVSGADERLRGDAAVVQAGAAVAVLVHERRVQPVLGGADGGDVAARSRADHQYLRSGCDISDDH